MDWLDHERNRMLADAERRAAWGTSTQSGTTPANDPFPPIQSQDDYEGSDTWGRDPDYPPGWWLGAALAALIAVAVIVVVTWAAAALLRAMQ